MAFWNSVVAQEAPRASDWIRKAFSFIPSPRTRHTPDPFQDMPDHLLTDIGFALVSRTEDGDVWERRGRRIFKRRDRTKPDPIRA